MPCATCQDRSCLSGETPSDNRPAQCPAATATLSGGDRSKGHFLRDLQAETRDRLDELIEYARFCGYRKIGLACCIGLHDETRLILKHLSQAGLEVSSVMCKTGGLPKADLGVPGRYCIVSQTGYGIGYVACNPVAQALILNREQTDINAMVGLCVGHDLVFSRTSTAPVVTLIAKDRAQAHNPSASLYTFYGDNFFDRREKPPGSILANIRHASPAGLLRFVHRTLKRRHQ